jgi:hypothetical protein
VKQLGTLKVTITKADMSRDSCKGQTKDNLESEVWIGVTFVLIEFSYMKLFKLVNRSGEVLTILL